MIMLTIMVMFYMTNSAGFGGVVLKTFATSLGTAQRDFITKYTSKIEGVILFLPTIILMRRSMRLLCATLVLLWVYIVPEHTVFQYVVQSVALFLFIRVKHVQTRLVIIGIVLLAYFSGYIEYIYTKGDQVITNSTKKQ